MTRDTEGRTGGNDREFLRDHLERLPRGVEPRRDLWPEIEREIRSAEVVPGRFRRWRRGILAVAAMLMLFAAALATGLLRSAPPEVARVDEPAPEVRLADSDAFHAAAVEDVLARLNDKNVDPATAEVIRRNLAIIDGAAEEIRRALEADPGNAALNHMLAAEYHRRGALLRRAARLEDAI